MNIRNELNGNLHPTEFDPVQAEIERTRASLHRRQRGVIHHDVRDGIAHTLTPRR